MGINTFLNGEKHFDEPKMDEPDTIVKISETYLWASGAVTSRSLISSPPISTRPRVTWNRPLI